MFTTNVGNYNLGMGPLFWVHLLLFLMACFSRQKVLMWFSFSKWTLTFWFESLVLSWEGVFDKFMSKCLGSKSSSKVYHNFF
jgi:hypothetical protein